VFTECVAFCVSNCVLAANPINKNVSLNKELEHLTGPKFGAEVERKCGCWARQRLRQVLSGGL
jgi:hypothetical protein